MWLGFPPRDVTYLFRQRLELKYHESRVNGGLGRPTDQARHVDIEGLAVWLPEWLRYRVYGCDAVDATAKIVSQIEGEGVAPACGDLVPGAPFPPRDETLYFLAWLDDYYAHALHRTIWETAVDIEGEAVWMQQFLLYVTHGSSEETATRLTFGDIDRAAGITAPIRPPTPMPSGDRHIPTGVVRTDGRVFVDDTGAWHPLGASCFWAPWGWKYDRNRTKDNLAFLAPYLDYIRIFGEVGGQSWADRVIDPGWPEYEAVMTELVDYCWSLGLRVEPTVLAGGTTTQRELAFEKWSRIVRGHEEAILHMEGANEDNFGDEPSFLNMVRLERQQSALLWAVNSPEGGDVPTVQRIMAITGAQVATGHLSRDVGAVDGGWRQVRQPWDWRDLMWPSSQNEPAGPETSVAEQRDPLVLVMQRAVGVLCGMGAYVFHCGAGVRGGGDWDRRLGRSANFWEVPDILTILEGLRTVGRLLPHNVENWHKYNGHWQGHPLPADQVWTDLGKADHGVVRTYGTVQNERFVTMPHGVKEYAVLTAAAPCEIAVHHPMTGVELHRTALRGGEGYVVNGPERGGTGA